ncbi:hypothetical protein O9992_00800 [Vibrio lentus]|nr:hypothetical protein [Vibrio lentus]
MDQKPNQFNEFDIKEAIRYNGNSWEAIRIGDSKSLQWDSSSKFVNNPMIDMMASVFISLSRVATRLQATPSSKARH